MEYCVKLKTIVYKNITIVMSRGTASLYNRCVHSRHRQTKRTRSTSHFASLVKKHTLLGKYTFIYIIDANKKYRSSLDNVYNVCMCMCI